MEPIKAKFRFKQKIIEVASIFVVDNVDIFMVLSDAIVSQAVILFNVTAQLL